MIKNKKILFRSDGSFRLSRKKADKTNSGSTSYDVVTNIEHSQSADGRITSSQPSTTNTSVPQTATPLPLTTTAKPRSYSPSDYYFHTTAQGGINASLTPLSEHYATNETLLSLFSTLYEKDQFSVAYAAGVKFVEVALLQIPQNGYFKSKKYRKQRTKSAVDALRVTKLLGGMVDEMEEDEETNCDGNGSSSISGVEKIEKLQQLATLAQRSFEDAIDDQLKDNDCSDDINGDTTSSPSQCQDWDVIAEQVSLFWKEWGKSGNIENMLTNMPDNCCTLFGGDVGNDVQGGEDEVQNDNKTTTKKAELFQQRQDNAPVMSGRRSLHGDFEREESQQKSEEKFNVSVEQSHRESSKVEDDEEAVAIISEEKVSHSTNNAQRGDRPAETRDEVKSESREDQVEDSRIDDLDEELKVALSMSLAESISSTISTSD
eukprot:scaffold5980_cov107-Skeletonema_marinoi.AAC.7